MAYSHTS